MTDLEIAWAAGFFDGEGYVCIGATKEIRNEEIYYHKHTLFMGINHVRIEPLLIMHALFGGTIRKQNTDSVKGNRRPRHEWKISTRLARVAAITLLPCSHNKKEALEIALAFCDTVPSHPVTSNKLDPAIREQRETLRRNLIYLNAQS